MYFNLLMNSDYFNIPIEPISIKTLKGKSKIATKLKISQIKVNLLNDASVAAMLMDDNNNLIELKIVRFNNEEYMNWKSDDNYIIDLIMKKIKIIYNL